MATPDRTLITEADIVTPSPLKTALDGKASTDHSSTHATGGSDPIAPSDIGAAPVKHAAQHATGGADAITPESIGAWSTVPTTIPSTTDLNTLTTPGVYHCGSSSGPTVALNYPVNGFAGFVEVTSKGTMLTQVATYFRAEISSFGRWYRTRYPSDGAWSPWHALDNGSITPASIGAAPTNHAARHAAGQPDAITPESIGAAFGVGGKGLVPGADNVDDYYQANHAGAWWVSGSTLGLPPYMSTPYGVLVVMRGNGSQYVQQTFQTSGINSTMFGRIRRGPYWSEWTPFGDIKSTGSPEGVVAAHPGTEYTDTAGTTGAWKWLKKVGFGTTGWVVTEGDTPLVRVPDAGLLNGYINSNSAFGLSYYRDEKRCYVEGSVSVTDATGTTLFTLPAWMRPKNTVYSSIGASAGSNRGARVYVSTAGSIIFPELGGGGHVTVQLSYSPTNPWPTSL